MQVGLSVFFFFFSSRRRHTRYWRDWSSDVCSSDLGALVETPLFFPGFSGRRNLRLLAETAGVPRSRVEEVLEVVDRSEERRVGKECRSRWSSYHSKKNKQRTSN